MEENRGKTLIKHTGIYAIGSFGSRLISFLLVPFYTFLLPTGEFGYYDLCFNVAILLIPIFSMQLREGALRFLLTADDQRKCEIITLIFRRLLLSAVCMAFITAVINWIHPVKYIWYTVALTESLLLFEVSSHICRGLERNMCYAISSLISAFFVCTISISLVYFADMGVIGVFIGNIAGRIIAVGYIQFSIGIFSKYLKINLVSRNLEKEITAYCLPMIVTATLIWLINSSNRLFIESFCGIDEVGIFAVAMKWGQIFEVIASILFMSWQGLAIKHYKDADRDIFFSKVLNSFIWLYTASVVFISFALYFVYPFIVGSEYQQSAMYVFLSIMSIMICYIGSFYDVAYQCVKKTKRSIYGLTLAACIILPANYFFVRWWGLFGILGAVTLAYTSLVTFRIFDTRKYFKLRWSWHAILAVVFMIVNLGVYQLQWPRAYCVAWLIISVIVYIMLIPPFAKAKLRDVSTRFLHIRQPNTSKKIP